MLKFPFRYPWREVDYITLMLLLPIMREMLSLGFEYKSESALLEALGPSPSKMDDFTDIYRHAIEVESFQQCMRCMYVCISIHMYVCIY